MWRSKKEQDGAELCQAQAQLDYAWLNSKFMNSNFFKHRGMSSSSGPPIKLFNTSIIVNKPARLTTIMNGFFINKVIQLRGRIPAADSDPVEKLFRTSYIEVVFHVGCHPSFTKCHDYSQRPNY